jgi:hypothetical protein
MVEGETYASAWGTSSMKLRFACKCGRKVYAYSGEDAAREAAHDE